jgi:prepilin peptidase CpaA
MLDQANLLSSALLALLAVLVAYASWTDVRQRRIPNWVSAVTLVAGLAAVFAVGGLEQMGWSAAHFAVALVAGMILTAFRWIGAGDAKFYAAIAAWLPIQLGLWLVVSVALAGLLLLVGFSMKRRGRIARTSAEQSDFDKLPYGIAIGLGGLLAVALA